MVAFYPLDAILADRISTTKGMDMESPLSKMLDQFAMQLQAEGEKHREDKRIYEEIQSIISKATHLSGFVKGVAYNEKKEKERWIRS